MEFASRSAGLLKLGLFVIFCLTSAIAAESSVNTTGASTDRFDKQGQVAAIPGLTTLLTVASPDFSHNITVPKITTNYSSISSSVATSNSTLWISSPSTLPKFPEIADEESISLALDSDGQSFYKRKEGITTLTTVLATTASERLSSPSPTDIIVDKAEAVSTTVIVLAPTAQSITRHCPFLLLDRVPTTDAAIQISTAEQGSATPTLVNSLDSTTTPLAASTVGQVLPRSICAPI